MSKYIRKGYNPKSLENLKPMIERPKTERQELGRLAGLKSQFLQHRDNTKIIERSCPFCDSSLEIKYDDLIGLIDCLKWAIEEYEQDYQNQLLIYLNEHRMWAEWSLSMFEIDELTPEIERLERDIEIYSCMIETLRSMRERL